MENVNTIIEKCIETGDWDYWGNRLTRNQLMDYLIHLKDTTSKSSQIECPLCNQTLKANKFTLTHRAVKYLMVMGKLTKEMDGTYGYIHYEDVRLKTKEWFGVNYTSYGLLQKWNLIEPELETGDKTKRSGYWRLTYRGSAFLHGRISIPETIHIMGNQLIKESSKKINVATAKDINFQDSVNFLKSF